MTKHVEMGNFFLATVFAFLYVIAGLVSKSSALDSPNLCKYTAKSRIETYTIKS